MQKDNKTIFIVSISIILLIIAVIGISYAYFEANISGLNSASTLSGSATNNIELTYTDGNDVISGTDIIPGWSASKKFTVENTGTGPAYYKIKAINITNNFSVPGSISLDVKSNLSGYEVVPKQVLPSVDTELSDGIYIEPGETHYYTVTTYYNDLENVDQLPDLGKSFNYKLTIVESGTGINITELLTHKLASYQQVEYIESTGTQYIDTGVTPDSTTDIEVKFMNDSTAITYQRVFGQIDSAGNTRYQMQMNNANAKSWLIGINGTSYTQTIDATSTYKTIKIVSGTGIYVDGKLIQSTTKTETNSYNILLFRGYDRYSAIKIASAKIWKGGELIRDLVPCYHKTDNNAGLCDLANDKFYANAGTGSFTVGPDV